MKITVRQYRGWRLAVLALATLLGAGLVLSQGPIPQDQVYHRFADMRSLLGLGNFWNVLSNLPFMLVGSLGISAFRGFGWKRSIALPGAWFFLGVFLTGLGSAWYHLTPTNASLVWDRIPMALVFMAFTAMMIDAYLKQGMGAKLLPGLLAFGLASVSWWWLTESLGQGDLRPYILVQYLPMLLLPLLVSLFDSAQFKRRDLLILLLFYLGAKLCELSDREIYAALQLLSGHSLKHLLAAAGSFWFLGMVQGTKQIS